MAKKPYIPTTEAEAIARITAMLSVDEKAALNLLRKELFVNVSESTYIRGVIKQHIEQALKEKKISEKDIKDEAKVVRAGITTRKPQD